MVSLLEYRKRKQGGGRDSEPAGGGGSSLGGTPTRPGSHYSQDSHHPLCHQQMQPPASPHSSFSSSIPQVEEVSPPDQQGPAGQSRRQYSNNQWMVPTTVERLREGQGVLERVLRSIKMERVFKRSDGSTEKESDADRYEMQAASPMKSPSRYSPSVYSHQSSDSHRQTDSPSFLQQTSNSPFRGSYSPSSGSFYPRLPASHPAGAQDPPPPSYPSRTPTPTSDSRPPAGPLHQQSGGSGNVDGGHGYGGGLLNSGSAGPPASGPRAHGQTKIDSGAQASRGGQPQASRSLKSGSTGQAALQAASRLTHYPQRGTSLGQFQHSPLQGPGVRTQSGSF